MPLVKSKYKNPELNQPIVILGRIVGYTKEGLDKHRVTISLKNVALKD